MEEWKKIKGYDNYLVSNEGRVKSLQNNKEKILKPVSYKDGYLHVILCKNGKVKNFLIHRLVAQAFIPNPDNLPQVNHKDEDKTNNSVSNLEWCTAKYNLNYGSHNEKVKQSNINNTKLSKKVKCIETCVVYKSIIEVERITGINRGNICQACKGKRKTAGKYHWKYV